MADHAPVELLDLYCRTLIVVTRSAFAVGGGEKVIVTFPSSGLGAGPEQLHLADVALAADESDAGHSWRGGAMISMAIVARRRGQIALLQQCLGVDAGAPARVLVDRQIAPIGVHSLGVGMTAAARLGDVGGVNGRLRIALTADVVNGGTVNARGHIVDAPLQLLAVMARPILAHLVDANGRI